MKIRVLHVLHQLAVGGAENGVVNIVNRMDSKRFISEIVTFVPGGRLRERVDESRVKVIEELNKRPGNDWRIPMQLAQILRRERPHIVHTHAWGTLCESWIAMKLASVSVWIHGEHGTMEEKTFNKRIQRYLWRRADQLLAVSEVLANRLAATMDFPRERIHTIINGVDLNRFRPELPVESLRASLNLSHETHIIGIVGRLEPVKDHFTFLQAMSDVVARHPNVCALIIGDGSLRSSLQHQVEKLKMTQHVRFLGRRSDIPQLLNLMDIFVLSSQSEGMSNTILEAMACALPVVTTNVGGNPELVIDGETGILVPTSAPERLGKAMLSLLSSSKRCTEMGEYGRKRVKTLFSLEQMVANYEELYLSLLPKKQEKYHG